MKIGLVTSWNTKCGIAEYSRYLVSALRKRDDVDVTVFGSKNYDGYKVAEDESFVLPTFDVLPWNQYGNHSFDDQLVLDAELDVLHVQYEVVLYNQEPFYRLLNNFQGIKAITYHDNCIPPNLPYYLFNISYTHREDVGVGQGYLLPMGIDKRTPVVKTFGLGRSRRDVIEYICNANRWTFEYSFGEDKWLQAEELYSWLRDSDLIVLYYDEAPAAGSSIAARVALSTGRPLIVTNTTWFKDLPDAMKVNNPEELESYMKHILNRNWVTWDQVAKWHVEDYKECLNQD